MRHQRDRTTRSLTTVVFTDIYASTETAARVGDVAWRRVLERHHALVRADLRRFGGHEVDTAGDGFFATFDSPGPAVDFALALAIEAPDVGVQVRAGVHIGEVEVVGGKAAGLAVHIGARICGLAQPGAVLVSSTVKDLVAGSRLRFDDVGETDLKGVPGTWHLYQAQQADLAAGSMSDEADRRAEARVEQSESAAARSSGRRSLIGSPRRRLIAVALGATVVLAGVIVYVNRSPTVLAGVPPNSVGRIDAAANGVVADVLVGALPDGLAFGAGSLWVTDTTNGTVTRVEPPTMHAGQTINVGNSPSAVAYGFDTIWVANAGERSISRVDPGTNKEVAKIAVGNGPSGVAVDDRWVWVTNRLDGTLSRIDPQSGTVTTSPAGLTPDGIAAGDGALWIADLDANEVLRVDPSSGTVVGRVAVGNGPSAITATNDAVGVVNSRDGTVSHIDPLTNSVTGTTKVGAEANSLAVGAGTLWVAVGSTSEIVRIDSQTATVTRRIGVASSPRAIAMNGPDPWFTARAVAASSHRGGTLKIVSSAEAFPQTVDPAHAFDHLPPLSALQIPLMTNDGLVGYKRTAGTDGLTLTADLAVGIPAPTDGGRTYTFQLRPGLIYSDGEPVMATDVRHSLERAISTDSSAAYTYQAIVGAAACSALPSGCDLSAGIVTDVAAGTVSFHLTSADHNFPASLADVTGMILPSNVPSAESMVPLPATGPYVIDQFTPGSSLRLLRNTRFAQWSAYAQPDGYPDEIDWTVLPADADMVSMVETGTADWIADTLPPERIDELTTRFAAQLHVAPTFLTYYQFMNVTLPPFDNPDVRRAVNLATDREQVIAAYGGPLSGRVTCQNIPLGFPGYVPYCPYTLDPNAAGTWRAPDVAQAHQLMDRSGTAGTPVEIVEPDLLAFRNVGNYFASLLDSLGLTASTKVLPADDFFVNRIGQGPTSTPFQMTGYWEALVDPEPSGIFLGALTCPDYPGVPPDTNTAHFCDPAIDQRMQDAVAAESSDPAAADPIWSEVDRRIVDESPAVVAFNPTEIELVSQRVGGFQHQPLWGLLVDQLWVQ